MSRTYNFTLPYTIDKTSVYWGYYKLQWDGILDKLPPDLKQKITDAHNNGTEVVVTSDELNEIDTPTWTTIASILGLSWS